MNIPQHFKLMEIFCGSGGLAQAALKAKTIINGNPFFINPVWANDIDRDACRTYALNIKNALLEDVTDYVVCDDVRNIVDNFQKIEYNSLAFGFPCNDFSMVGETKGFDGEYGPLYTFGVAALKAKNPLWFLAENVGGLQSANNGKAFETILHDLENSGKFGYRLTAHYYKFEEYGVPQARHRIIIVGIRQDLHKKFLVPSPTTHKRETQLTCKQSFLNPQILPDSINNERTKQSKTVEERLMCLPPGENAWFLDKIVKLSDKEILKKMSTVSTFRKQFPEAVTGDEIRRIIERVRLNVKSTKMSHIYKRLDPDKPSYTVTGSGGGGTHIYHWSEPRALTNRERARLQTFDDNFVFIGSKESVRKQIGMAVPPAGAKHIFLAILKTFGEEKYQNVPANLYETGLGLVKHKI
jgi:DNA (cytosine-5)-methyltransferase 1